MVKLKVDGYKIISKPRRMFYFFQPSEAIQGSRFDLIILFENIEEKFHGGSLFLKFRQFELEKYGDGESCLSSLL